MSLYREEMGIESGRVGDATIRGLSTFDIIYMIETSEIDMRN